MHLMLFNNMSLPYSRPTCKPFTSPSLNNPGSLERIKRYFKDYKSQINNKLAGIGQPTKGEEG